MATPIEPVRWPLPSLADCDRALAGRGGDATELSGRFGKWRKPEVLSSGFSRSDEIADQNL